MTRQEINASITRGQLFYSSQGTNSLTHRDGFMRYDNGSRITVTNAWVNASEAAVNPPEDDSVAEEEPPEDGDGDDPVPSVGARVASGLYFYTLTAGDFAASRKMLIMK